VKEFRKKLEMLWLDKCEVIVSEPYRQENGATAMRDKILHSDIPCKLSFFQSNASNNAADLQGPAAPVQQLAKLILGPEIEVPPGCRIRVMRQGRALHFKSTGQPMVCFRCLHQEILMEAAETWA